MGLGWAAYSSVRYSARQVARSAERAPTLGEGIAAISRDAVRERLTRRIYDQVGVGVFVELTRAEVKAVHLLAPPQGYVEKQERREWQRLISAGEIGLFCMINPRTNELDFRYGELTDEERAQRQNTAAAKAAKKARTSTPAPEPAPEHQVGDIVGDHQLVWDGADYRWVPIAA